MVQNVVRWFWPDLKDSEIKKFGILSIAFLFTIGTYWMLRLLKDTVFFKIAFPEALGWAPHQGGLFQPLAKFYSVFVVIFMVLIYSKLVDLFEKHKLFYIICSFYAVIFGTITVLLVIRDFHGDIALGKNVLGALGWVSYFAIESFGSIVVSLFWAFVASVTDTDSAKRGYPFIIAGAQIGAIGGSALNIVSEHLGAIWKLFFMSTLFLAAIMFFIYYFMKVVPASELVGNKAAHKTEKVKEGFFEGFVSGLRLLVTRPYLFGILIVSTFYEVVNTIIDYQMKRQASVFPAYATELGFNKFLGYFGVCTNGLAFVVALLGTSYLMKRYGLSFCLLVFPVCLTVAFSGLYLFYQFGGGSTNPAQLLWVTFGVMMIAKGLSYAVNNPAKDMMYIPTSKDAKFKSKGWIDMFGGRTAKAAGGRVTDFFKSDLGQLMTYGTVFGLGVIGIWILFAIYVGATNKKLIQENKIVE